ncbi:MAG: hypothetical protein KatS3mg110_2337 [Pirellulaceae bacterium]|nr:MAG: hypothetical protein KatS3mg110_2337 [Pirellulaceae bacterium]
MTRGMLFWLAVLCLFAGGMAVWAAWRMGQSRDEPVYVRSERDVAPKSDEPLLTEFTLTERSGRTLGSRDLMGTVWVASFFFTSCPGSCRAQNLELLALHNAYAKKGVKFVSITCDPLVDTPAKLREYADQLGVPDDTWYFLTGDLKYIRRVGAEIFRVWLDERGHMDRFVVIDRWGNIRGHFDWHDQKRLDEMKQMLDRLLAETAPPEDITPVMAVPGALPHRRSADDAADSTPESDDGVGGAETPAVNGP